MSEECLEVFVMTMVVSLVSTSMGIWLARLLRKPRVHQEPPKLCDYYYAYPDNTDPEHENFL